MSPEFQKIGLGEVRRRVASPFVGDAGMTAMMHLTLTLSQEARSQTTTLVGGARESPIREP